MQGYVGMVVRAAEEIFGKEIHLQPFLYGEHHPGTQAKLEVE